ncbi:hypothetical protein DF186_16235, partial [Enterococcus hirae]
MITIFITLTNLITIPQLPISHYPIITPPNINILTTYTKTSIQTINNNIITPIKKRLSNIKNILYYKSTINSTNTTNITITFKPKT